MWKYLKKLKVSSTKSNKIIVKDIGDNCNSIGNIWKVTSTKCINMKDTDPDIFFEKFQNFYNGSFISEEDLLEGKNFLGELSKFKKN